MSPQRNVAVEDADLRPPEPERLGHPIDPGPSARALTVAPPFEDRRDERLDRVDLPGIKEGAEDPPPPFDQEVREPSASQLIQQVGDRHGANNGEV